jgi:hypothetical protein
MAASGKLGRLGKLFGSEKGQRISREVQRKHEYDLVKFSGFL